MTKEPTMIKIVHPFSGMVAEEKVKMEYQRSARSILLRYLAASDLLADEEGVIRSPHDIDIEEAISICNDYGYYTFV